MTTTEVGQLPTLLNADQRAKLEQLVPSNTDVKGLRLLRDYLLHDIDEDNYYYNRRSALRLFPSDSDQQFRELLSLTERPTSGYLNSLDRAAEEYINRVDTNDRLLIADLINPGAIPNEPNYYTRRRIENIMSALYQTNKIDRNKKSVLSPYEIMMQMSSLTVIGGSSNIYLARYMDRYPMLIKATGPREEENTGIEILSMLHEYLVGTVVNRLRRDIPNFMYTYGLIRNVKIDTVNGRAYYTERVTEKYTLAVEYISNAIPINGISADKIAQVSINGQMQIYERTNFIRLLLFQVFCSMMYAYSKIGFVHRDAHLENILVVTLPTVMAVPVMVPVSYTWSDDDRRIVDIQFERRWILTNILVMFIDYGLSTVDAVHLHNTQYKYSHLISVNSIYNAYEKYSAFENDMALFTLSMGTKVVNMYLDDYRQDLSNLAEDFARLLYKMYTGITLNDDEVSERDFFIYYNETASRSGEEFNYYVTHPRIKYDPYGAVIDYCNRYSNLFTTTDYSGYTNVLHRSVDRDVSMTIVSDTREYYWYQKYSDILSDLTVDFDSIEDNQWYRENLLSNIMPHVVYNSTDLGLAQVLSAIIKYIDDIEVSNSIMESIARYVRYFRDIPLNMLPFRYEISDTGAVSFY